MQVLTYNIAGRRGRGQPRYLRDIAALIKETGADIVGLQEVVHHPGEPEPEKILAEMTGLHARFVPAHETRRVILGNAILTRGPIHHARVHELPWRLPERRVLLEVETTIDDHRVSVFNTHLVHLAVVSRMLRRGQALAIAKHLRHCHHAHVLMGDLNAGPRAVELVSLRRMAGKGDHLDDLRSWPARRPLIQYDHIWPGPGWEVVEVKILDQHISDHRPVLARLRWRTDHAPTAHPHPK